MNTTKIQFLQGIDEEVVPEIRLLKDKYGVNGSAIFRFNNPFVLLEQNFKEIQGMYLIDKEGVISTSELNISVSKEDGKYTAIQAIYSWNTEDDFNRFMRFAYRYAEENGLGYQEK
tara:strand:+ start:960 stop:1307 length:348 start_codon:yes stop_codon:yes gene_type:complete